MTRAALITGAGTGIGASTALALAADGLAVALVGRRREPLEAVAGQIGERAHVIVGDIVTDAREHRRGGGGRARRPARGGQQRGLDPPQRAPARDRARDLARADRGQPHRPLPRPARRAPAPARSEGDRSIVNVGSTLAHKLVPGIGPYAAAKGGLVSLTRALAVEYGPDGIRANAVMPAVVDTPLAHAERPDFDAAQGDMARAYPLAARPARGRRAGDRLSRLAARRRGSPARSSTSTAASA